MDNILPPESEEDNIEYKRLLSYESIGNLRIDGLVTQMRWRVKEGSGIAYYYLGVNDNGSIYGLSSLEAKETLQVFREIVKLAQVEIVSICTINSNSKIYYKATIKEKCVIRPEIRVIVIGPENSGKTTFVSGLVHKQQDNGNGYLRNMLLTHKHELYSGKSNSVTIKTIGDADANINYTFIDTPSNILENKCYFEKLINISNFGIVITNPDANPSIYIDELIKNSLDFIVINTKTSTELFNQTNSINLDLCNPIPKNFLSTWIKPLNLNKHIQLNSNQNNSTFVLKTLYSGDCLYLLTCVQVLGSLNLSDTIHFDNSDATGTIESIQYMGCSLNRIDLNVTFTCFIKTDQIIKKLKGDFFYST
jgi:hypothetical protein